MHKDSGNIHNISGERVRGRPHHTTLSRTQEKLKHTHAIINCVIRVAGLRGILFYFLFWHVSVFFNFSTRNAYYYFHNQKRRMNVILK